jgi:predicted dienelactone hydrolase
VPSAAADAPVGFTQISVPGNTAQRGNDSGRLNVIVWYPAIAGTATSPIEVGPPGQPYFREGTAAPGAPMAASPVKLPFVVVSHGTGGTAMDLSWLCAALAAHGYLVASVDHPGNNALEAPTVAGATLWWQRADDLSRVIDGVLATPNFGPSVDPARIGAAGLSLGGLTVLMIAGAASDPAYRAAALSNQQSHRDSRVKAVFSIAPALGPAIVPESLSSIDVPVELVAGFGDPVLPVADNVIADALAIPNAQLIVWPRPVAHYTFLTDCTLLGATKFPLICTDAGPSRVNVHRATAELALSFFAHTIGR